MKLASILQQIGDERSPSAPPVIMYMPPSGAAIECPSLEAAKNAAPRLAAKYPGATVAVYELVGWARAPVREPEFTSGSSQLAIEDRTDEVAELLD
jgi:hypothetical protein